MTEMDHFENNFTLLSTTIIIIAATTERNRDFMTDFDF